MEETIQKKSIAIIGAGISGLIACKYVISKGFDPIIFEFRSREGGLWTKTLETTKLQSPKHFYEFSDFPWPSSVKEQFPDHYQVLNYIQSYARHFDLIRHIRFNSRVTAIHYEGVSEEDMRCWDLWSGNGEVFGGTEGKWKVSVEESITGSTQFYSVDFVILCLGRFSDVPNVPEFCPNKGPEAFDGEVIHSMEYSAMDESNTAKFINGKRVTVVGMQKNALDIAVECSNVNGVKFPCTVMYRTVHWILPNFFPWGVNLGYLYLSRFAELLLHKPDEGILLSILTATLFPLKWAFSKFVESYTRWKVPLAKYGMVPTHDFCYQLSSCRLAILPGEFYKRVDEGSIVLKKFRSFGFCKQGILIDDDVDDEAMKTDCVILATGFRGDQKLRDIFQSSTFRDLVASSPTATFPFYRHCIHPRVPQVAVIGYSESLSDLFSSEMKCRWVAELLSNTFKLPSITKMEGETEKWDKCMKGYGMEHYRPSCLAHLHIWYNDQLCKDMGMSPRRKKGFIADWFEPYLPADYSRSC